MSTDSTHSDNGKILEVRGLKTYFFTEDGIVRAVDGVDFYVKHGEVLGLVGESGCGKSVTLFSVMRLVGVPGRVVGGEILFEGQDILGLPEADMQQIRGNRISMIFQQPASSLNPVFKVGDQIAEVLNIHKRLGKNQVREQVISLLETVGIPEPTKRMDAYPHELSGGMAQRVMIAMALACVPELLIADEPTTALDVTIQAQILDLLRNLRSQMNTSIVLVTHDLGIVAEMCDRVAVMYAGRLVEETDVETLFAEPMHPYTVGLIGSVPVLGQVKDRLETIPGSVPNLIGMPPGCKFAPRCLARLEHLATVPGLEMCTKEEPALVSVRPRHSVRCWLYQ